MFSRNFPDLYSHYTALDHIIQDGLIILEITIKSNSSHRSINQMWNYLSVGYQRQLVYHIFKFRKYLLSIHHVPGLGLCSMKTIKIKEKSFDLEELIA